MPRQFNMLGSELALLLEAKDASTAVLAIPVSERLTAAQEVLEASFETPGEAETRGVVRA